MNWASEFLELAKSGGLNCEVVNEVNGWLETVSVEGKACFTKSVTYNKDRRLFFLGVDPSKIREEGDYVLVCGGRDGHLVDVFVIPWRRFFDTLARGEPLNTYELPREYLQYKLYLRDGGGAWILSVQGGDKPKIDVSQFRYGPKEALNFLKMNPGR